MSEAGDGLDHLRIPFEKIKFGKKLEVQGYGTVFEGEFDDQRVALKQLNITNLANIKPKLLAEILTISRFRHPPNLVALLGFCDEKTNEIILVYEYVASGNLADEMRKRLKTIQRLEICLGAARGLDYLHTGVDPTTPGIVHGNIKPSKILLNSDANTLKYVAKVSSFGLSKIVPGKTQNTPESSDGVTGKPTKESDVYSFGVLLLEVLCGVSELVDTDDYQERHVTELVPKKMQQNKLRKVVHLDIRKEIKAESLETYAKIACQCVTENPDERPQMAQVVEELEKALRLQGGEVTYVQIPKSRSIVVGESIHGNDSEDVNIQTAEEDVKDLIAGEGFDDAGEDNGEKNTVEDTRTESVPNKTNIEDAKTESSSNDQKTEKGNLSYLNSKRESNITVEKEEENTIPIKNADKEISTNDPETTKEPIDDFDSDNRLKIIDAEENKEDDDSTESTTTSESSNDDISTSTNQDVENENDDNMNGPESTNEESNIVAENEVNNESNITSLESNNVDDNNMATGGKVSDAQLLTSNNEDCLPEVPVGEDSQEGDNNVEMMSSNIIEEEFKESVPNKTHIKDTKTESSNNDPEMDKENLKDSNSIKESNITVKNEDENTSNLSFKDAKMEISTNDHETTEEPIEYLKSNKKSKIIEENKEDDERMKSTTTSEFSNGNTRTSTDQEAQDSWILKSERGDFSEVIEDELKRLRIPFDKIKFGQKLDVRGYGSMFEGEFNHQQVALKRLNITNLGNIKPKLLSAILTISRFRQHPNLVALIGFCDENNKEIILVYEYVSGGNLAGKMSKHLNTIQRLQICIGAARGLEYLHTGIESVDSKPGIIHGDLKLSRILLKSHLVSSEFEAKVSGFGLPKLLPGHVEIAPKSMDPVHAATGQLSKESDVYTFGVLLLEVLCGVPELVDTDDYHERHVTELVPKRLEQNMLRKIVHFDIRDEITTESLETYAKIACRCVLKNPEERPTMTEVVEELEKALRLQGGKLSNVQLFGSSNGNIVPEVPVYHEGDDNGVTISSKVVEEEFKFLMQGGKVSDAQQLASSNGSNEPEATEEVSKEDVEKENRDNINVHESTEDIDSKSNEESTINGENEVNTESKITASSLNSTKQENCFSLPDEKDNVVMMNTPNLHIEEIMEVQNSTIPDDNAKAELLTTEKPALIVNTREGFSNPATQTQKSESKRSDSTCSESSTGDDTTPSDHLLPKSPHNEKKTSRGSRTCSCCCCSVWQFISDRVVLYGGQFWSKLVSFFTWITGQCSSKRD